MRAESSKIYDNIKKRMNPFEFTSDVVHILNHIYIYIYIYNYIFFVYIFCIEN